MGGCVFIFSALPDIADHKLVRLPSSPVFFLAGVDLRPFFLFRSDTALHRLWREKRVGPRG